MRASEKSSTKELETMFEFSKRLQDLMSNASGISPLGRNVKQAELAKHLGITRQAVSAYVMGISVPDILKFKEIADFFHVSYAYLLGASQRVDDKLDDFLEKTNLRTKTLKTILEVCENPIKYNGLSHLIESAEFHHLVLFLGGYLDCVYLENNEDAELGEDEVAAIRDEINKRTNGKLDVIPHSMLKIILRQRAHETIEAVLRQYDEQAEKEKKKKK